MQTGIQVSCGAVLRMPNPALGPFGVAGEVPTEKGIPQRRARLSQFGGRERTYLTDK